MLFPISHEAIERPHARRYQIVWFQEVEILHVLVRDYSSGGSTNIVVDAKLHIFSSLFLFFDETSC
jgi:hypothetical protein